MTSSPSPALAAQLPLIEALRTRLPGADADHPAHVIETHISWVLLAGGFAYKIKKAVDLGFVDFTTLELRRHYCDEELRLNRRLAPDLYLDVVAIRKRGQTPFLADVVADRKRGQTPFSMQDLHSSPAPYPKKGSDPFSEGAPLSEREAAPESELPVEYAVRMREFPQDALASHALQRGDLRADHIDALAELIAEFHRHVDVAPAGSEYGSPQTVAATMLQNFDVVDPLSDDDVERAQLAELRTWTEAGGKRGQTPFSGQVIGGKRGQTPFSGQTLASCEDPSSKKGSDPFFELVAKRQQQGFVRECHGDLHLGNMVLLHDRLVVFDCIEFNARFRWIDVISEVAFVVMDLIDRGAPRFAHRFLNAYLEHSGDYAGLAVLPMYRCYRAMVRAKVARLRIAQMPPGAERDDELAEYRGYLTLARKFTEPPSPMLLITHGLSGSGKSTVTQGVLETIGAVRLRTDVERKRMFVTECRREASAGEPQRDLANSDNPAAGVHLSLGVDGQSTHLLSSRCVGSKAIAAHAPAESGIYSPDATRHTYARVADLARDVLQAGFPCIVDAAFLKRWQRDQFRALADELDVPFTIIAFTASESVLRARVEARAAKASDVSDADVAILEHQLRTHEPLASDELAQCAVWDSEANAPDDPQALANLVSRLR